MGEGCALGSKSSSTDGKNKNMNYLSVVKRTLQQEVLKLCIGNSNGALELIAINKHSSLEDFYEEDTEFNRAVAVWKSRMR